jgi:hypothetical protein
MTARILSELHPENLCMELDTQVRREITCYISVFLTKTEKFKIFFYSINCPNPTKNWNLFCKLLMLYPG